MLASRLSRVPGSIAAVFTTFLLGACGDASLTQPTALSLHPMSASAAGPAGRVVATASASPDIGGVWQWRQTTRIAARPFAAQLVFGIAPEGPMTQITCESGGELTIVPQTESTFVGSATQSSECRTQGGVVFNPVPFPFPPALQVENGEILGHNFRFDFTSGGLPCPQTGAIRVHDGQAVELRGTGDCRLPDEHQLVGSYKDVQFVATR